MRTNKNIRISILTIISIFVVIIAYIYLTGDNNIKLFDLIIRGLKIIFITYCLINLEIFKVKKIFIGYFFIFFAWVWNYTKPLIEIESSAYVVYIFNTLFYEVFSILGIVILAYGIWETLNTNKSLIRKLQTLAFYNPITKLPNRNMILNYNPVIDELGKKLNAKPMLIDLNRESTLMFLDIDDFKLINDSLGHFYGDVLLEEVALRLKLYLSNEDVVIHLSGDEFLIVMYNIFEDDELILKATDIIDEMRKTFTLITKEVHVSCSLGIAIYPLHGETIDIAIQKADIAMYRAKKQGKNQYFIYNESLDIAVNYKFDLIAELRNSIKNSDFVVHYQTKAKTFDNEITGLEALVRWVNPERGLLYPVDFISLAEEIGVIRDIDIFVLNKVCQQIELWLKENKKPYNISVNISPLFFNQHNFIDIVDKVISQYEIDNCYLSIEITENIALKDIKLTQDKILQLKKRNIKVYLDDFGSGYSSLSYVKEYPIDYLKIDKVFIDDIIINKIDLTLVKTIVEVSNILGIKVIFEGVETKEQLDILKEIGCNEYQGYYLSKPKPIDEIDLKF